MNYSEDLVEFVKGWEELRLVPYLDAVGVPTVGYGHVLAPSAPHPISINREMADLYLKEDLDAVASGILELVDVTMAQQHFDALCSFCFNLGVGAFKRSTLLRKINDNRFDDAAHEFNRWVYAGDRRLLGLVKRRAAERAMFTEGRYDGRP